MGLSLCYAYFYEKGLRRGQHYRFIRALGYRTNVTAMIMTRFWTPLLWGRLMLREAR